MLRCPVVRQVCIVILLLFFFKSMLSVTVTVLLPLLQSHERTMKLCIPPPPSDYHLVKRRCFYLRQEQCLTDYVISRNYMQICHRYKSAAVRGLTFLFVTSKHSSVACLILLFRPMDKCPPFKRTNPRSSVFTFFSHITAQMFICLQFGLVHEINATLIHLRSCWALFFTNIKKTVYNLLKI